MRFDKFTIKSREAVQEAMQAASSLGHQEVGPEHLLLALLRQEEGTVTPLLRKVGVNPDSVRADVQTWLDRQPKVSGGGFETGLGKRATELFNHAFREADAFRDEYVSTEHLLLAAATAGGDAQRLLEEAGAGLSFFAKFGEKRRRESRSADAHYLMGLGFLGKGRKERAKAEFAAALALNANHVWAKKQLDALE